MINLKIKIWFIKIDWIRRNVMEKYKLFDAELKFMNIIWEEEPIKSGELVKVCNEKLGWKKSTTYTVLRKLAQRGVLKNENTVVTSIVKREDTQIYESHEVVEKSFGGSLPKFLTAFFGNKKISNDEAEELKKLIDSYKED
ncbi:transcriptional regulator, BlaI/MecI/CopY family [Intestinibacter bartlettii DSM 16795]|nr:transcriptional regulator, BlaI/MecI/CopY family [Intestinibacter bartlettii DSM 16795]